MQPKDEHVVKETLDKESPNKSINVGRSKLETLAIGTFAWSKSFLIPCTSLHNN
jgi:hypothetical protein